MINVVALTVLVFITSVIVTALAAFFTLVFRSSLQSFACAPHPVGVTKSAVVMAVIYMFVLIVLVDTFLVLINRSVGLGHCMS